MSEAKRPEGGLRDAGRPEGGLQGGPVLRIVRGEPDDAELAALTVVLASAGPPPAAAKPRSAWADRRAMVRAPLTHGPGAWRASGLPR